MLPVRCCEQVPAALQAWLGLRSAAHAAHLASVDLTSAQFTSEPCSVSAPARVCRLLINITAGQITQCLSGGEG